MIRRALVSLVVIACCCLTADATNLAISIGIRETQAGGGASGGPVFSNGGATGGIEFVNLDGQMLNTDGSWQQFTFTPMLDTLTAFAGGTANSMLDGEWGVLEMIRIRNVDGITLPIRMWIDNVTHTDSTGTVVEGFEGFPVGSEVMFQEPTFSGSTSGNLLPGGISAVTDTVAFDGSQSYEMDFQFVDDSAARWVRLTTFNTPNLPNPAIRLQESAFTPSISFWARAIVIPEPHSLALWGMASALVLTMRRRI